MMNPPPRIVTVWCADWPAIAAGLSPDRPAAVFFANRVVARTRAAADAGVRRGQRRREAQRLHPGLEVIDHDPDRDGRSFEPVARAVAELAPRLEVVEPGWLCLAARGPSRYFGGDRALAERLVELTLDTVGPSAAFAVGVGVADGRVTSAIAARLASRRPVGAQVVPSGDSAGFLAPLPIGWIGQLDEASPELVGLFARLGLRTCGELAALDERDVMSRFGTEGLHAYRLASGADARPPSAEHPPPERAVEHRFDDPIEQLETVIFIAKRLADRLGAALDAEGRRCTRLMIVLSTEHGERCERLWYRDRGLAPAAMVERVRWQLEGWVSQSGGIAGGVVTVRLQPDELRADTGTQDGFWGGRSAADGDAARAVTRLSGIAGEDAVTVPEWVGGRLPDDRYRWVVAGTSDLDDPGDRLDRGDGPWPGATVQPSPAVVFGEPIPIELFDDRGRSVVIGGRGDISSAPVMMTIEGERYRIVAWAGPWPVEQRWWDPERARRLARLQLVTEQGVAHLVAREHQCWSMLATYS